MVLYDGEAKVLMARRDVFDTSDVISQERDCGSNGSACRFLVMDAPSKPVAETPGSSAIERSLRRSRSPCGEIGPLFRLPMSIEELLDQMEQYRLRREQRDSRPDWLKQFIQQAAGVFEPLTHVGRVGYDCQVDELGWIVCMYLGTTEIVGGARDGRIDHAGFRIDLSVLRQLFANTDRFEWYSMAEPRVTDSGRESVRSLICVHGMTQCGHAVRLELMAAPPDFAGPGLHCRPDGSIYETQ